MTTDLNTTAPATTPETAAAAGQVPADTPETTRRAPVWRPLTDIVETPEGVMLMVEMPGVGPDDVEVTLEKRVLTIRGRSRAGEPGGLRPVHAEYEPGDYERAFTLSEDFDGDRIEARMKDGVLTLRLPRAEMAQPKAIKVAAG